MEPIPTTAVLLSRNDDIGASLYQDETSPFINGMFMVVDGNGEDGPGGVPSAYISAMRREDCEPVIAIADREDEEAVILTLKQVSAVIGLVKMLPLLMAAEDIATGRVPETE